MRYANTTSVAFSSIDESTLGFYFQFQDELRYMAMPTDQVNIDFHFYGNLDFYRRYPDTIVMGLTKVGGMLAILNIGLFLRFLHRKYFEKDLQRQL